MIDEEKVRDLYNNLEVIWDQRDCWHFHTYSIINRSLQDFFKQQNREGTLGKVLLAGSGGNAYGTHSEQVIHLDIAENLLKNVSNAVVGSVTCCPFQDNSFDTIICVGSVLNYVDAMETIREFSRILKDGGKLILEFESSESFEYLFTEPYKKSVGLANTFYRFKEEKIWVYSFDYIKSITEHYFFSINKEESIHLISPLIYRLTKKEKFSSKFSSLDKILSYFDFFRKRACNKIIYLDKF